MTLNLKSDQASFHIQGIGVSPGVATGEVFPLAVADECVAERKIGEEEIPRESLRLQEALLATRRQIMEIRRHAEDSVGETDADVFETHLMLVDDQSFIDKVLKRLHGKRTNVEPVVLAVAEEYMEAFSGMEDEYLKERGADFRDVVRHILQNLAGGGHAGHSAMEKPCIVVAEDLAPSETATLDKDKVLGFATDLGSPTSHTAIMARSLGIPAVVGLRDISSRVSPGDTLLIDGRKGLVIVNPGPEELARSRKLADLHGEIRSHLNGLKDEPAETADGHRLHIAANIESVEDLPAVRECGAEGVGLFRTEFLFLSRPDPPSEEEQRDAYEQVARELAPAPVVIRTIDLGGDKLSAHFDAAAERNPFMGCRGIRFCLSEGRDLFLCQLRAILGANRHGNVKILLPMVGMAEEIIEATELLDQAKGELRARGEPFDGNVALGAMIEVPSAALAVDLLAPHVSFVSIGTNDLVQYVFAADRTNERVAGLQDPAHPAVLRLLRSIVEQGDAASIGVCICGEMAANSLLTPLVLGLGVREVSVAPNAVPLVKSVVRGLSLPAAQALAGEALRAGSGSNVLDLCREFLRDTAPEILELVG